MGNRAIITDEEGKIGLYLHWNGGYDSVSTFLTYCKLKGYRGLGEDTSYGLARLAQVVGNFFGGDLSVGIEFDIKDEKGIYKSAGDNGTYIVKGWDIVKVVDKDYYGFDDDVEWSNVELEPHHEYFNDQANYTLLEFLNDVNQTQPESEQIDVEEKMKELDIL